MGSEKKEEKKSSSKKKNVGADNLQPVDVDNATCRLRQADAKLGEKQGFEKSDKTKSNQNLSASTSSEKQSVDSDTLQNLNVIFYTVACQFRTSKTLVFGASTSCARWLPRKGGYRGM